jgi:hypothetical protein
MWANSKTHMINMPTGFHDQGWINATYFAETANPPLAVASGFVGGADMQDQRNPLVHRPHWQMDHFAYPFTNVDKRGIARMYQDLDLLQSLFPLTRSCVSNSWRYGHCGACWFCSERQWGFGCL